MWGLAAAATITFAVFAMKGFPPAGYGTEGTIGAAKKYQAQQLADKDVVLGDAAVQEFLQSDTFDRLMKDPNARTPDRRRARRRGAAKHGAPERD